MRKGKDCPSLDSIQEKERKLIKTVQEKKERGHGPREGVPPFVPKPVVNGEGCGPENGVPCKPTLDMEVRRRGRRDEEKI